MKTLITLLITVSLALGASRLRAEEPLSIAAAADLVFCLEALNKEFKSTHADADLKVSTGSSGNFFAQIKNGAPFHIFLSADVQYPQELIKANLAAGDSLTKYAVGRLVLWTTREGVDVSKGMDVLKSDAVKKVAIANPEHAPYGRAAKAALEQAKLWEAVQPKIIMGENIAATAQYVESGNVDAGLVALSLVLAPRLEKVGRYYVLPEDAHPRLEQAAVLTNKGAENPLAKAYLEFLRSDAARKIFDHYGFRLPDTK